MFDRDEREIIALLTGESGLGADVLMEMIEDAVRYGDADSYTESVLSGIYEKLRRIREE